MDERFRRKLLIPISFFSVVLCSLHSKQYPPLEEAHSLFREENYEKSYQILKKIPAKKRNAAQYLLMAKCLTKLKAKWVWPYLLLRRAAKKRSFYASPVPYCSLYWTLSREHLSQKNSPPPLFPTFIKIFFSPFSLMWLYFLSFIFVLLSFISGLKLLKKGVLPGTVLCLLLFSSLSAFTFYASSLCMYKEGIILSSEKEVYSGPTKDYSHISRLSSYSLVKIEKKEGSFYKIHSLSYPEISGWIEDKNVVVI